MNDDGFDIAEELVELRCHSTEWLRAELGRVVVDQRRLKVRELSITRVLDERATRTHEAEDALLAQKASMRTARDSVEISRHLEALPAITAAVHAGDLSVDQLKPLIELATPETDAAWADRAKGYAPTDLERLARQQRGVTAEDAAARREARELRCWTERDSGMVAGRFRLPDVDGVLAKSVLERMAERMRPPKGGQWDSQRHRMADAFVDLCKNYADVERTGRAKPHVIVQVPLQGPPVVDGIPVAAATLDAVLADAVIEQQVIDAETAMLCTDSDLDQVSIPADVRRFVLARDRHCRAPGCENSQRLQIHHMNPRCRRGNHDPNKLAAVCPQHHPMLEPHGPYQLVGNPNEPDGLRLVRVDELPDARAGPDADAA